MNESNKTEVALFLNWPVDVAQNCRTVRPCIDKRRKRYRHRFGLSAAKVRHLFRGPKFLDQLDACHGDAARRLLLGISLKWTPRKEQRAA